MNTTKLFLTLMFAALLGNPMQGRADDIDIYSQPTGSVYNPNVLIILDNSSNWSRQSQQWPGGVTQGYSEANAISTVLAGLGTAGPNINIGLMEYGSSYAGYIRYAVRPMTTSNVASFNTQLATIKNNITSPTEKVPSANWYGDLMYDAYNYYAGLAPVTPGSSGVANNPDAAGYTSTGYTQFLSPISTASSCARNFIIFIGNPAAHGPTSDTSANSCALYKLNNNTSTCPSGNFQPQLGLPNFTSTSTTTNTTLGNTAQCYASSTAALASEYTTQCANYSNGCTATSVANTAPVACPTGQLSYSVWGTTNAQPGGTVTYNISTSSMGTISGNNADWSITTASAPAFVASITQVTIANCPVATSGKTLNGIYTVGAVSGTTFHITADKNAPVCTSTGNPPPTVSYVQATIPASTTNLGYTSTCFASQAACTTADYTAQCSSYTGGCACGNPTASTTPSCATGTNLYNVVGTSVIVTNTPTGTTTVDTATYNADEWAKFLYSKGVPVSGSSNATVATYTIDVYNAQPDATETSLYLSMANNGGGKYFSASNESAIANALKKILNEVQAVNSVFASSSLPVSVNAQGTYLNQIYMGMFRPDPNANPRWLGNLKQYQFILSPTTGALQLGDSLGNAALSSAGTGFISPNAVSFWTCGHTGIACSVGTEPANGFWVNNPSSASAVPLGFDLPDGALVERGGAAQQTRQINMTDTYPLTGAAAYSPRNLYTWLGTGTALTNFANTNAGLTAAAFGNPSSLSALINWVRGDDNQGDEYSLCPPGTAAGTGNCPNPAVTIRPSVHGDVLHSRPTVVNYGTTGTNGTSKNVGVVVYYGDNGGVFHAVNGNQTNPIGSTMPIPGSELWGFIPSDFFARLGRQMTNSPTVCLPSTLGYTQSTQCNSSTITPTPMKKDYFVDGGAGLYQLVDGNGVTQKAYLYLSMRRGGNFIYALDVSDPAAPKFLWKVDNTSPGMGELGQTWSQPKVAEVEGYTSPVPISGTSPVLIFGAGYDTNEDNQPPTADSSGRGIFVLDAITGTLVWKATYGATSACPVTGATTTQASCTVSDMKYAIPADITLTDRDGDGIIERFYAADTGGNIWRVDLEPTAGNTPDKWRIYKLAALGCDTGPCSAGTTPRKFLYPPDVIPATATYNYDSVVAGSGDREHPLHQTTGATSDKLFLIKDIYTGNDATGMTPVTLAGLVGLNDCTTGWGGTMGGYYISLASEEKVVNAPLVAAGYAFISTNQPAPASGNSCTTNLGIAKGYRLSPFAGTCTSTVFSGGGLPPSPVGGVVNIVVGGVTTQVPFLIGVGGNTGCVGSDCSSALGGQKPPITVNSKRTRTYWYIDNK